MKKIRTRIGTHNWQQKRPNFCTDVKAEKFRKKRKRLVEIETKKSCKVRSKRVFAPLAAQLRRGSFAKHLIRRACRASKPRGAPNGWCPPYLWAWPSRGRSLWNGPSLRASLSVRTSCREGICSPIWSLLQSPS